MPDEALLIELGNNVKAWRKRRGLSQRELAERLGMQREAITRLEAGQNATFLFLARVAKELSVDLPTLFIGLNLADLPTNRGTKASVSKGQGPT